MALEVGQLITPSIRIVRRLGAGGMGSVWVAEHLSLQTQVVVKIMAPELAENADAVARFKAEASAAAQVKSPHVVQMLDHGVAVDGSPYIVMELLEGNDLRPFLVERSLSERQLVNVVVQVARALSKAHERGVIHRDIKPGNIFVCNNDGEHFVKLLDFGIAKSREKGWGQGNTQTGMMMGSPPYMSPEQLRGAKSLDHRADLWSLAVVFFEALVGHRPFLGDSVAELAIAIHTPPPPVPSIHDPSLPPALDRWFERAFAQEPAARFSNAKEFSDALEVAMFGERMSSGPVSTSAPASFRAPSTTDAGVGGTLLPLRRARRWPFLAVGAAVLVGGALGIARLVAPEGQSRSTHETSSGASQSAPQSAPRSVTATSGALGPPGVAVGLAVPGLVEPSPAASPSAPSAPVTPRVSAPRAPQRPPDAGAAAPKPSATGQYLDIK